MGFFKDILGAAAPVVGGMFGGPIGSALGGMVGGAISGGSSAKDANAQAQAAAKAAAIDPRAEKMIYGDGSANSGLLNQYQGLLNAPRSDAATSFANANGDYLKQYGAADLGGARDAAYNAMQGNSAPMAQAAQMGNPALAPAARMSAASTSVPAYAVGNMVNAPSQNGIDLKGSYDRFVNGTPGANPYLDQSIDGAIAQNRLGFGQLQDDQTKNLMENIMPSIRSASVLSGQYGGSRQGIAEGKAIGTTQTELARAGSMFGQNATNAAVGAKANAYETDSNRALSATQGLGAQQYGVAHADAQTKNQAEFMNVNNMVNAANTNASFGQQASLANLGTAQQTNLANQGAWNNTNQTNAGFNQQTNLSNQGAQLSTNGQNNSSLLGGAGLLSGLTNQAGQAVNANDNYDLQRAQGVNGLLSPYLTNSGTGQIAPQQSVAGQTIAGGLSGLALGNQLGGLLGGFNGSSTLNTTNSAGSMPTGWAPSQLPVQGFPVMPRI